jgi:hypothetical protein
MKAMLIGGFGLGFAIVSAQAGKYGVAPSDRAAAPTRAPHHAQGHSQGLASAALKTYAKSRLAATL